MDIHLPKQLIPTHIRLDIARVEWQRIEWMWQSGATPKLNRQHYTIFFDSVDVPEGVYSVSRLGISIGEPDKTDEILWLKPLDHFPPTYMAITNYPLGPISPSVFRSQAVALQLARIRWRSKGSVADDKRPGIGRFRACVLFTRCLLTTRLDLEDVDLIPLNQGLQRVEELDIVNRLLVDLRFRTRLPTDRWLRASAHDFPLAVLRFRLIWATGIAQAFDYVESLTSSILAVLSGHRFSSGEVIATVVESLDFQRGGARPGSRPYQGNLLGGFLSGEDPSHIEEQLGRVKRDPILSLFAALHSEAIAEREPNFAYFRYWNLLEAIATRRIRSGVALSDFSGAPIITPQGETITTSGARGRVYALIQRHFIKRRLSEASFGSLLAGRSLWEVCGAWIALRDATAHNGGFRPDDEFQRKHLGQWRTAKRAYDEIVARGGEFGTLSDPYFVLLREISQLVVSWQLDGDDISYLTPNLMAKSCLVIRATKYLRCLVNRATEYLRSSFDTSA